LIAVVKSISYDQREIIDNIKALCGIDAIDCDLTYGNGAFYKGDTPPDHRFDLDDSLENLTSVCSSTATPLADSSISSAMFDPPFLTYVRGTRTGNGNMVMAKRFAGYWRYDELESHYRDTLKEASRILANKGIMIFKCQDIIHNHKMHCTHANVIQWGAEHGFRLKDLFILNAKSRMPSPNRKGTQKHARIFHCYFMVLELKK